jgi:hypothetical protein
MPYERIIPRYTLRLEDLQATDAVEVECPACRRRALVATHRLHDRFAPFLRAHDPDLPADAVPAVGSAGRMEWNVVRAAPQNPAY